MAGGVRGKVPSGSGVGDGATSGGEAEGSESVDPCEVEPNGLGVGSVHGVVLGKANGAAAGVEYGVGLGRTHGVGEAEGRGAGVGETLAAGDWA